MLCRYSQHPPEKIYIYAARQGMHGDQVRASRGSGQDPPRPAPARRAQVQQRRLRASRTAPISAYRPTTRTASASAARAARAASPLRRARGRSSASGLRTSSTSRTTASTPRRWTTSGRRGSSRTSSPRATSSTWSSRRNRRTSARSSLRRWSRKPPHVSKTYSNRPTFRRTTAPNRI